MDTSSADVADLYIDFVFSNIGADAASIKSECIGLITVIINTSDFGDEQAIKFQNSGRFFLYRSQPLMFEEEQQFYAKIIEQEPPPPEPPPPSFYLIFIFTNLVYHFINLCFDVYVADFKLPSSAKNPPYPH